MLRYELRIKNRPLILVLLATLLPIMALTAWLLSHSPRHISETDTRATPHHAWPNWLGPERNGISREDPWQRDQAPDKPVSLHTRWTAEVGTGCASVAIRDGRLYTSGNRRDTDTIYCLNARTGKKIWTDTFPCKLEPTGFEGGPTATPTLDEGRVYMLSRGGDLRCLDAESGKVLWARNALRDLGVGKPQWGFAGSPLLLGGRVIVNLGCAMALDKLTGQVAWRSAPMDAAYATPAVIRTAGRELLAIHGHTPGLALLNAHDGSMVTSFTYQSNVMVSTPVIIDNRIAITASEKVNAHLLELVHGKLKLKWQSPAIQSWLSTPVPWQGYLYGFHEQDLCCIDLNDGQPHWTQPGIGEGTLTLAGGRLIVQGGTGTLVIADATPEGYRERARVPVLKGRSWAAPVLVGGMIYCRSNAGRLVCLEVE